MSFFIATNGLFAALMPTISTFANERSAFLRERQNGMYSTFAYFSSRCIVEYPLQLVMLVLFVAVPASQPAVRSILKNDQTSSDWLNIQRIRDNRAL